MAINIADQFGYFSKKPLDSRTQYATLSAMKAVTDANVNEGCLAYCVETDKYYKFLSSNSVDTTTGKWREFESGGGGGASSLNDLSDVTISSATSGQVLKNNGSGWVNGDVPSDDTKQPKTLDTPLTIDGASVTTVEGGLSSIGNTKQPKTLSTPITINGTQYTTVEGVLQAFGILSGDVPNQMVQTYASGVVVADFEADIRAHYFDQTNKVATYGDFIYWRANNLYDWTITNNAPNGNSAQSKDVGFYVICKGYNRTQLSNAVSVYMLCFEVDRANNTCNAYEKVIEVVNVSSGEWQVYGSSNNKWNSLNGASIDTSKLYSTDDTAETAIADTDYFPFQDVSASAKRKTLWSNVKSVLKTYFDSLYSGIFTNATELAKIGEQNGVPTYDGQIISLPTVHNFDKNNLYSTTEQVVGKWTDGRPLYQKTISGTTSSSSGTQVSVSTGVTNGANARIVEGHYSTGSPLNFYNSASSNGFAIVSADASTLNVKVTAASVVFYATIQYTKTTDAANSFNYASENDYSTSETIVGTWIDGSLLYQRTFTGTTNSSNGAKAIVTLASGYTVRNFFGTCRWGTTGSSGGEVMLPWYTPGTTAEVISLYTQGQIVYINQVSMPSKEFKVTVQYTKS